jgi:hypothetical protein
MDVFRRHSLRLARFEQTRHHRVPEIVESEPAKTGGVAQRVRSGRTGVRVASG